MKIGVHLVIALFTFTILLSCAGSSGDDSKSPGAVQPSQLGYSPSQRWPEQGSYSYNIKYNYNGLECITQKNFTNKANYCMGLQSTKLNDSCAKNIRQSDYEYYCGNDFQEMDIPADFKASGYDQRLKKQCITGDAGTDYFPLLIQYCQFLKNETLHSNCHWDSRFEKFKQLSCKGEFSLEPIAAPINPAPQPDEPIIGQPGSPEQPQPPAQDDLDQIEIVHQLRALGIDIEVDWQAIRQDHQYSPGGITLEKKMQQFWTELASIKDEIIKRKNLINKIHVTSYTTYSNKYLYLSLQYDLIAGEGKKYFPLFDQLQKIKSDLGLIFTGIHGHGLIEQNSFSPLVQILNLINTNYSQLIKIKGVIKEIKFENFTSFYASTQELNLKQSAAEQEFKRYLQLLGPLAPIYQWTEKNSVKIDGDFDLEKQTEQMHTVFKILTENISDLNQMVKADFIEKISINYFSSTTSYLKSSKELSISTAISTQLELVKSIKSLGNVASKSLEIKKPIILESSELSADYYKSVQLLEAVWSKIKTKAEKITEIRLSYSSSYYENLQELNIGYSSTVAETLKIIDGIK